MENQSEQTEVKQIADHLPTLVRRLLLTSHDAEQEEYILTEEETEKIIKDRVQSMKDHFQYQRLQLGEPLEKILLKIAEKKWEEEPEIKEHLKRCNSNKHHTLWEQENRKKEKEAEELKIKEIKESHDAKFFFRLMAWTAKQVFGKDLIQNEHNKPLIKVICFFLSKDPRFETELGYSFSKGLLVRGVSGLGKTFLFECVKDNQLIPLKIFSMIEIAEVVKEEGSYNKIPVGSKKGIYLDDVGTEEHIVKHYGTPINFFKNFIETYYLERHDFSKLIISTNNSFDEIQEKYGFRVRSRIREMFNIIDVTGVDMRN